MRALNYSPLPEDRESAVQAAEECLRTLRRSRAMKRIEEIKQQIAAATPEKKAALYQQYAEEMKQLED